MKNLPLKTPSYQYLEKSFKEWLDILGYAPTSVYNLPNHIREFLHHLETKEQITSITNLTNQEIKTYYQKLKDRSNQKQAGVLSNSYLNKHLQALTKFMEYLEKVGKLDLPHLAIPREKAEQKHIEVLTIAEVKELYQVTEKHPNTYKYEAIASRDKAMLTIFYSCGLRRNEGYHLDQSDVNLDTNTLHVRKGKNYKQRKVPFNKANAKILQDYLYNHRPYFKRANHQNALFMSIKGKRMNSQSLAIRLKILLHKTDNLTLKQKEVSLHTLRHTIATHLLTAGMKLEQISRFLGHTSLESTQIYTHLVSKKDEELQAIPTK
jgi:integrase/recombinase XerD